ncbi:RAC family serine/threonine-protein kinase-like protein [Diplonema papillatum]|nr:RAC family serine/threonine-protein kinase-like protein [Diplonema papillatum]
MHTEDRTVEPAVESPSGGGRSTPGSMTHSAGMPPVASVISAKGTKDFSDEQQVLMTKSWENAKKAGLDQLGFKHYKNLVAMGGEEVRKLFMYTHLDRQQKMLVSTMKWMLNHMQNNGEALRRLAIYHAHLGITKSALDLFGRAFIQAMRDTIGESFTDDMEDLWKKAYRSICDVFEVHIQHFQHNMSQSRIEDSRKDAYLSLRNYFRDNQGEGMLALSDKQGHVFVSQYAKESQPSLSGTGHDRTQFRKRFIVLRGRYLYIQRSETTPPSNVFDLGYMSLADTSVQDRFPSPSPFSFALIDEDKYVTYVLCTGDDDKEAWYQKLMEVLTRFSFLKEELPRSKGVLQVAILGEKFEAKEFKEDDFEMLTLIGRGSFGKVYKVREVSTGKIYAVKVLQKSALKVDSQIADIKQEKAILLQISHPFIVKLHASFQSATRLFLLFTFLSGGELFYHMQKCSEHYFSEPKAAFYIAETALAVSYLHSKQIIHRDLKAENLVLDAQGHITLTDFGFARTLNSTGEVTCQTCGTLAYMAPEIFAKSTMGYGPEVDWWSLGVLFFNMLTGCYPFLRENTQETIRSITTLPLIFPDSPMLSCNAVDLVRRLLTKRAGARLSKIEEFKAHPFFEDINWDDLYNRKVTAPFVPDTQGRNTKYFEPCAKGMSLASVAELEASDEFRSFFDVHESYLVADKVAAKMGTDEALLSRLDIPGLLTPSYRPTALKDTEADE